MASESKTQWQATRFRQVEVFFRRYRREAARAPRDEKGDPIETPEMQQHRQRIWELHHAITLNEHW